jgi:hypothetical protein
MLTVPWAQPEARALGAAGRGDCADVTLVNFGPGERPASRAHRAIPGGCEQAVRFALAQPVRALTAHAGGARGLGDAPRGSEDGEEGELAGGGPAVPSPRLRPFGLRIASRAHRPAWSSRNPNRTAKSCGDCRANSEPVGLACAQGRAVDFVTHSVRRRSIEIARRQRVSS